MDQQHGQALLVGEEDRFVQISGELFRTVQESKVFHDSKTFVDCIPRREPETILQEFAQEKQSDGFDLRSFIEDNFILPDMPGKADTSRAETMEQYIDHLWHHLVRPAHNNSNPNSSLLPLSHPYIVPGGRFREIYYWDSYFIAEGLRASGEHGIIDDMVTNLADLIDRYGFVPTGNRVYYLSRSQPPVFSFMLAILAEENGIDDIAPYLDEAEQEHAFWMAGSDGLGQDRSDRRVVRLEDGTILNRYWDSTPEPRPESYREDKLIAQRTDRDEEELYRNIRAACESGWDFSSRWFHDDKRIQTIHTTDILPVDLNSFLYHHETQLADWLDQHNRPEAASTYRDLAADRKDAIKDYMWDSDAGFYFDYDWVEKDQTATWSLAGAAPLFVGIASQDQAEQVASSLCDRFLEEGGLVTTLQPSPEQWDAPNGWAPLHWMAVQGLRDYGFDGLAEEIASRWIETNRSLFAETGKMHEKYNVVDPGTIAGGGEYQIQDGFGWTNGVVMAFLRDGLMDENAQD
jgi:alpha,alpha-trehalase